HTHIHKQPRTRGCTSKTSLWRRHRVATVPVYFQPPHLPPLHLFTTISHAPLPNQPRTRGYTSKPSLWRRHRVLTVPVYFQPPHLPPMHLFTTPSLSLSLPLSFSLPQSFSFPSLSFPCSVPPVSCHPLSFSLPP